MTIYMMKIAYDGTPFIGWQRQPKGVSIQESIELALQKILKDRIPIIGSGRTDSGVHAYAQVAHFSYSSGLDLFKVQRSLNGLLPKEIRIYDLKVVSSAFHARYSAVEKEYHYYVSLNQVLFPHYRNYTLHASYAFSLPLVKEAIVHFIGKKDFTSFANVGGSAKNFIRHLHAIDCIEEENRLCFVFRGEGFLYKMVRNIMGTLLEVGQGKKQPEDIVHLLAAKDRRAVGKTAPAKGLFLASVTYPMELLLPDG